MTPPLAAPIVHAMVRTIVPDEPAITSIEKQPFRAADTLTISGSLLLAPGTQPGTATPGATPGGLSAAIKTESVTGWPVQFLRSLPQLIHLA